MQSVIICLETNGPNKSFGHPLLDQEVENKAIIIVQVRTLCYYIHSQ
jgi:hypothetical protein